MERSQRFYLIPYLIFLGASAIILWQIQKGDVVLWINDRHSAVADVFFKYFTHLGDGLAVVAVIIVLLILRRFRHALVLVVLGVSQAIVSAILKMVIFGKSPRPAKYFEGTDLLNFVEGVSIHHWNAFPSGHTMTFFALTWFVSTIVKRPVWAFILFLVALTGGISRIYLNLHFFEDVVAGSIVGVLLCIIIMKLFKGYLSET